MNELNTLIETIFANFTVDNVPIPVSFMFYEGHGEPYVVYSQVDADNSFSGDDEILGYVVFYDFDVYSKANYNPIIERIIALLEANGFKFQPSRSSGDMFETDTRYYHKTLQFAILREV